MKITISLMAGGVLLIASSGHAQSPSTNAVLLEFPAVASESVATNFTSSLLPLYDVASMESEPLRLDSEEASAALGAPTTEVLNRIETGPIVIEGSATPALKAPGVRTFVNLFNPFAPAEYGGQESRGGRETRGFYDPVKSEPGLVLISVGSSGRE